MISREIISTLRPFLRGLPLTILLVIAAMWAAGKYVSFVTPVYESTARIKLADNEIGPTGSRLYDDMDYFATKNKIAAEIELIKSNVILDKVADHLADNYILYRVGDLHSTELYDQAPIKIYSVINDSDLVEKTFQLSVFQDYYTLTTPDEKNLKAELGRSVTVKNSEFLITRNEELLARRPDLDLDDNYRFVIKSKEKLVNEIRSNLDVMAMDKDVPVLRISYKSQVPQKAHDVVNLVAGCYIRDYEETKFQTADTTVTFLDSQLKQYAEELRNSESNIEDFRNSENIINIRQETETDLRKIADLKKQLSNIRMNLAAIDTLNMYINKGDEHFLSLAPNFEAFNDLLSTELIKKLRAFQAEKKELLTLYTSEHEKIRVIDENVHEIIVYIKESIHNTKVNTKIKKENLEQEIAEAEAVFVGLPTREKTLGGLERENQLNESIFRFLHEKKTEAEIARAAKMSFHRIIDYGEIPRKPNSPNPGLFKALAAFLAFLLGTLLSYIIFNIRFKIGDDSFIQKRTLIPVIKTVPYFKKKLSEQLFFSQWASVLWLNNYFQKGEVLCFTSVHDGRQKEFVLHRIANSLCKMGKKTIVLINRSHPEYESSDRNYAIQFIGDFLSSENVWNLSKLNKYDCVICDPGSLSEDASSLMLLSACQKQIIVMDALKSNASEIDQANELNETLQGLNLEIILNRSAYYPGVVSKEKVVGSAALLARMLFRSASTGIKLIPKIKQAHR
ncbi:MAG: Wzz/FepE/Etk N-terminal domain-containing protein [Bacteroidia bacterium]